MNEYTIPKDEEERKKLIIDFKKELYYYVDQYNVDSSWELSNSIENDVEAFDVLEETNGGSSDHPTTKMIINFNEYLFRLSWYQSSYDYGFDDLFDKFEVCLVEATTKTVYE